MSPGILAAVEKEELLPGGWVSVRQPASFTQLASYQPMLWQGPDQFVGVRRYLRPEGALGPQQVGRSPAEAPQLFPAPPLRERHLRQACELAVLSRAEVMPRQAPLLICDQATEIWWVEPLYLGSLAELPPPSSLDRYQWQDQILHFFEELVAQLAPLHDLSKAHGNLGLKVFAVDAGRLLLTDFETAAYAPLGFLRRQFWGLAAPESCASPRDPVQPSADVWALAACILTWLKIWPSEQWGVPSVALQSLKAEQNSRSLPLRSLNENAPVQVKRSFQTMWARINVYCPQLSPLLKKMLEEDPLLRPSLRDIEKTMVELRRSGLGGKAPVWRQARCHSPAVRQRCGDLRKAQQAGRGMSSHGARLLLRTAEPLQGRPIIHPDDLPRARLSPIQTALCVGPMLGSTPCVAGLALVRGASPLFSILVGAVLGLMATAAVYWVIHRRNNQIHQNQNPWTGRL